MGGFSRLVTKKHDFKNSGFMILAILLGAVFIVVALLRSSLGSLTWMLIISPVFSGILVFLRARKRLRVRVWKNSGSAPKE